MACSLQSLAASRTASDTDTQYKRLDPRCPPVKPSVTHAMDQAALPAAAAATMALAAITFRFCAHLEHHLY